MNIYKALLVLIATLSLACGSGEDTSEITDGDSTALGTVVSSGDTLRVYRLAPDEITGQDTILYAELTDTIVATIATNFHTARVNRVKRFDMGYGRKIYEVDMLHKGQSKIIYISSDGRILGRKGVDQ